MVKEIQVKVEQDPPEPERVASSAAAAPSARNLSKSCHLSQAFDNELCKADFCEKLCLVKLDEEKLWPALRFESIDELQEKIKDDLNISGSELTQLRLIVWKTSMSRPINGAVAYLLGKEDITSSFTAVHEETVHEFFGNALTPKDKSVLESDDGLNRSYSIVMDRIDNFENNKRKANEIETDAEVKDITDEHTKKKQRGSPGTSQVEDVYVAIIKDERDQAPKAKEEITESEVERWRKSIHQQFAALRYDVDFGHEYETVKPLSIYVKPDPRRKYSFLLQPFLDGLFDDDFEVSAFATKKDFNTCRKMLFDDILSIAEAKKRKEDDSKPPFNISSALKSRWNVIFTKTESCGRSKYAKGDLLSILCFKLSAFLAKASFHSIRINEGRHCY